jgi:hypothetical protein
LCRILPDFPLAVAALRAQPFKVPSTLLPHRRRRLAPPPGTPGPEIAAGKAGQRCATSIHDLSATLARHGGDKVLTARTIVEELVGYNDAFA